MMVKRITALLCALMLFLSICGCSYYDVDVSAVPCLSSDELNESELKLYAEMYGALCNLGEKIYIFGHSGSEVADMYLRILDEHPEFFWLGNGYSYSSVPIINITVFSPFIYDIEKSEIQKMRTEAENKASEILSGISEFSSDYAKELYLHNALITTTQYDNECAGRILSGVTDEFMPSATIYGALCTDKAVCSGYAAAFQYLCTKIGLECRRVCGYINSDTEEEREFFVDGSHAWNIVKIDGDYYYVDVTWDDPSYDKSKEVISEVYYDYFNITEKELSKTHEIGSWENVPDCTATKHNYYTFNRMLCPVYSKRSVTEILDRQFAAGDMAIIKFNDENSFKYAKRDLIDNNEIFRLKHMPKNANGVKYTEDENSFTYMFKYY